MKILVVVDMQNDFIDMEKGALPVPHIDKMIPNIDRKIREYLEDSDNYIFFTQDTHAADSSLQRRYIEAREFPRHCILDTWGWDIIDSLKGYTNHFNTIWKSTFGSPALINRIKELTYHPNKIESIELVGVCTDICVLNNAIMLRNSFPAIPIKVSAPCCAGTSFENHRAACRVLEMNCIDVEY